MLRTARSSAFKNTEAIQLLKIVGDPERRRSTSGDFQLINTRITVRGKNVIIVDPVLLGTEGLHLRLPQRREPACRNRRTSPAIQHPPRQWPSTVTAEDRQSCPRIKTGYPPNGRNNGAFKSIIRDFRSGNSADNSADLARGFIRDQRAPED